MSATTAFQPPQQHLPSGRPSAAGFRGGPPTSRPSSPRVGGASPYRTPPPALIGATTTSEQRSPSRMGGQRGTLPPAAGRGSRPPSPMVPTMRPGTPSMRPSSPTATNRPMTPLTRPDQYASASRVAAGRAPSPLPARRIRNNVNESAATTTLSRQNTSSRIRSHTPTSRPAPKAVTIAVPLESELSSNNNNGQHLSRQNSAVTQQQVTTVTTTTTKTNETNNTNNQAGASVDYSPINYDNSQAILNQSQSVPPPPQPAPAPLSRRPSSVPKDRPMSRTNSVAAVQHEQEQRQQQQLQEQGSLVVLNTPQPSQVSFRPPPPMSPPRQQSSALFAGDDNHEEAPVAVEEATPEMASVARKYESLGHSQVAVRRSEKISSAVDRAVVRTTNETSDRDVIKVDGSVFKRVKTGDERHLNLSPSRSRGDGSRSRSPSASPRGRGNRTLTIDVSRGEVVGGGNDGAGSAARGVGGGMLSPGQTSHPRRSEPEPVSNISLNITVLMPTAQVTSDMVQKLKINALNSTADPGESRTLSPYRSRAGSRFATPPGSRSGSGGGGGDFNSLNMTASQAIIARQSVASNKALQRSMTGTDFGGTLTTGNGATVNGSRSTSPTKVAQYLKIQKELFHNNTAEQQQQQHSEQRGGSVGSQQGSLVPSSRHGGGNGRTWSDRKGAVHNRGGVLASPCTHQTVTIRLTNINPRRATVREVINEILAHVGFTPRGRGVLQVGLGTIRARLVSKHRLASINNGNQQSSRGRYNTPSRATPPTPPNGSNSQNDSNIGDLLTKSLILRDFSDAADPSPGLGVDRLDESDISDVANNEHLMIHGAGDRSGLRRGAGGQTPHLSATQQQLLADQQDGYLTVDRTDLLQRSKIRLCGGKWHLVEKVTSSFGTTAAASASAAGGGGGGGGISSGYASAATTPRSVRPQSRPPPLHPNNPHHHHHLPVGGSGVINHHGSSGVGLVSIDGRTAGPGHLSLHAPVAVAGSPTGLSGGGGGNDDDYNNHYSEFYNTYGNNNNNSSVSLLPGSHSSGGVNTVSTTSEMVVLLEDDVIGEVPLQDGDTVIWNVAPPPPSSSFFSSSVASTAAPTPALLLAADLKQQQQQQFNSVTSQIISNTNSARNHQQNNTTNNTTDHSLLKNFNYNYYNDKYMSGNTKSGTSSRSPSRSPLHNEHQQQISPLRGGRRLARKLTSPALEAPEVGTHHHHQHQHHRLAPPAPRSPPRTYSNLSSSSTAVSSTHAGLMSELQALRGGTKSRTTNTTTNNVTSSSSHGLNRPRRSLLGTPEEDKLAPPSAGPSAPPVMAPLSTSLSGGGGGGATLLKSSSSSAAINVYDSNAGATRTVVTETDEERQLAQEIMALRKQLSDDTVANAITSSTSASKAAAVMQPTTATSTTTYTTSSSSGGVAAAASSANLPYTTLLEKSGGASMSTVEEGKNVTYTVISDPMSTSQKQQNMSTSYVLPASDGGGAISQSRVYTTEATQLKSSSPSPRASATAAAAQEDHEF